MPRHIHDRAICMEMNEKDQLDEKKLTAKNIRLAIILGVIALCFYMGLMLMYME